MQSIYGEELGVCPNNFGSTNIDLWDDLLDTVGDSAPFSLPIARAKVEELNKRCGDTSRLLDPEPDMVSSSLSADNTDVYETNPASSDDNVERQYGVGDPEDTVDNETREY